MAPYSMDLRERVVRAWDASGDAEEVAATFAVSRAWVHRLVQRRRETGSIAPRPVPDEPRKQPWRLVLLPALDRVDDVPTRDCCPERPLEQGLHVLDGVLAGV